MVCEEFKHPYTVAEGKRYKIVPQCHGCLRTFADPKELRIQTIGMRTYDNGPFPATANICINLQCIEDCIAKYAEKVSNKSRIIILTIIEYTIGSLQWYCWCALSISFKAVFSTKYHVLRRA
jgi:hypothetical protein